MYRTTCGSIAFMLINFVCILTAAGQSNVMSLGSGTVPAKWILLEPETKPGNVNVTIRNGHTITLDGTATSANLTIEQGASLNSLTDASSGDVYMLSPGGATALATAVVQNDGTLGSTTGTNDGIAIAIPSSCSNLKITGTGTSSIGSIRPAGSNKKLLFELDQNLTLNYSGVAFSAFAPVDSSLVADSIAFTINTGKILTIANTAGQFHGSSTNGSGGRYIYNINGTLDLSATTTVQQVTPFGANASSIVTLNVNGLLKLGTGFNSVNSKPATANGKVVFNIADGGLVDAIQTTALTTGKTYFITNGTGALKRRVDHTDVIFPVGTPGSVNYNPVTLNNAGTAGNFTVRVKDQFDNAIPFSDKAVNKQWTITPDSTSATNVTVSPQWLAGDQTAGFNASASVAVMHYIDNLWKENAAALTGAGTENDPYKATATGFTSLGLFAIQNSAVITADLASFTAAGDLQKIQLDWTTSSEQNTDHFIVEKSTDGTNWQVLTTVSGHGTTNQTNTYQAFDNTPVDGVNYYRLRYFFNGSEIVSAVQTVSTLKHGVSLTVFPNPVSETLTMSFSTMTTPAVLNIVTTTGKKMLTATIPAGTDRSNANVSGWFPGVYIIMINNNGKISAARFIKL